MTKTIMWRPLVLWIGNEKNLNIIPSLRSGSNVWFLSRDWRLNHTMIFEPDYFPNWNTMKHDKDITIKALATECNTLVSIKSDFMFVQKPNTTSLTGNVQAKKRKDASIKLLFLWWLALRTFLLVSET